MLLLLLQRDELGDEADGDAVLEVRHVGIGHLNARLVLFFESQVVGDLLLAQHLITCVIMVDREELHRHPRRWLGEELVLLLDELWFLEVRRGGSF